MLIDLPNQHHSLSHIERTMSHNPSAEPSRLHTHDFVADETAKVAPTLTVAVTHQCHSTMSVEDCRLVATSAARVREYLSISQKRLADLDDLKDLIDAQLLSEGLGDEEAARCINRYFNDNGSYTRQVLGQKLSRAATILDRGDTLFKRVKDRYFGFYLVGRTIRLGASYFDEGVTDKQRDITLLHEWMHRAGANRLPPQLEVYEYDMPKLLSLPTNAALNNADSLALFVYELSKGGC